MSERDVKLNRFTFTVAPDKDSGDIEFSIGFDNHVVKTYLTGWSNCWECTSAKLEEYIYTGQATIELDFDTEPTTISMKREGDRVYVHIEPSDFSDEKAFSGVCSERDFLRELYDGLLYAMTFRYDDIGCGLNWDSCKMVCYNRMKSRSVEEYIRTGSIEKVGNYVVKHILAIRRSEILHICDETIGYHIPLPEMTNIVDKEGKTIASINIGDFKAKELNRIADSLPADFDLWLLGEYDDGMVRPQRIERKVVITDGEIFDKADYKVPRLGKDPYGFTSETLWTACDNLDLKRVMHFMDINADLTYILKWILHSNLNGTYDSVGNSTYEESEQSMRERDRKKYEIIKNVLCRKPNLALCEDLLKMCAWCYCPKCLGLLLECGANPNERDFGDDWRLFAVKYRSVTSVINHMILRGEEKYGILAEMKNYLESYGAKDIVVINDAKKDMKRILRVLIFHYQDGGWLCKATDPVGGVYLTYECPTLSGAKRGWQKKYWEFTQNLLNKGITDQYSDYQFLMLADASYEEHIEHCANETWGHEEWHGNISLRVMDEFDYIEANHCEDRTDTPDNYLILPCTAINLSDLERFAKELDIGITNIDVSYGEEYNTFQLHWDNVTVWHPVSVNGMGIVITRRIVTEMGELKEVRHNYLFFNKDGDIMLAGRKIGVWHEEECLVNAELDFDGITVNLSEEKKYDLLQKVTKHIPDNMLVIADDIKNSILQNILKL